MSFISDIGDFTNPAGEEEGAMEGKCEGKQGEEEGCARETKASDQLENTKEE